MLSAHSTSYTLCGTMRQKHTSLNLAQWVSMALRILRSKKVTSRSSMKGEVIGYLIPSDPAAFIISPKFMTATTSSSRVASGACVQLTSIKEWSTTLLLKRPNSIVALHRFDYDEVFGTALNRFVVEATVGHPLTVYGEGGQTRGFIDIRDTVRCIELAALNPAEPGEMRVFNQFTEQFSVLDLAQKVAVVAGRRGLNTTIKHLRNPCVEKEEHYYHAKHTGLLTLGLQPHLLNDATISKLLEHAARYHDRINLQRIVPTVTWKGSHQH